jgi:ubiquinone biosynthesis protein Coq4
MITSVDRTFGEQFLRSIDDFNAHGVHLLFNEWWEKAPAEVIEKYVDAITSHPEQGPLAREAWYAQPQTIEALSHYAPGTLGAAYHAFMVDNGLAERLALGYRELHEEYARSGQIAAMPPIIQYKVLRGYQTHDLHHVLTNYPATPFGEIALQAFGLAQMDFPYAAMWIAVVTGHMALVDPWLIKPAMDAISDGWTFGRAARSIQFVKFETMLDRPLDEVRAEFGLDRQPRVVTPDPERIPILTA